LSRRPETDPLVSVGQINQCIKANNTINTMNAKTTRKLDMMKRVHRFILEHTITPAIPRLTAAHTVMVNTITALETAAQNQVAGSGQSEGGVDLRVTTARDLREYLKNVNRTARMLETDYPGIRPTFRLPRTDSYPKLIASAQAIIAAATPLQAAFVDAGLPVTFLTELQALLTAFQNATNQKQDGGITQVLGTAALTAKATLGVKAATDLDACVRNHFRGNAEMLAAWSHARRIEKAPRRSSVLAGGGLRTGQAVGQSDDLSQVILDEPVGVPDLFATISAAHGINPAKNLYDGEHPVPITDGGKAIGKLFG
jgi:hypothetical protein